MRGASIFCVFVWPSLIFWKQPGDPFVVHTNFDMITFQNFYTVKFNAKCALKRAAVRLVSIKLNSWKVRTLRQHIILLITKL
jgi:hypothetical protein